MTLDLTAARDTAEATLTATCSIGRKSDDHSVDFLDPDTLELVPWDPDVVVFAGPCSVRPTNAERVSEEGAVDVYRHTYRLLLPVTAEPAIGDVVTVTAVGTDGDPRLVDRELVVVEVAYSSRAVLRRATALDRRPGPRL